MQDLDEEEGSKGEENLQKSIKKEKKNDPGKKKKRVET